mgnify:CR=1 FL=1
MKHQITLRNLLKFMLIRGGEILPDKLYLSWLYRLYTGNKLDWEAPITFTEKLQVLKLYVNNTPLCTRMADKYHVREIISNTLGEEYLIPILGVWNSFDEINFTSLPNQFVLKTTHDSGGIVICKNKFQLNLHEAKKKLDSHIRENYFYRGREYQYRGIPPRIIAEQFMVDESGTDLKDYKFFCFDGEPKVLFVASERFNGKGEPARFTYYDMDLNVLPFSSRGHKISENPLSEIPNFEEMKSCARILSKGFPHLRVDFYNINGKVYFGELTFHHDGGLVPFEPHDWNVRLGQMIHLPDKK